MIELELEKQDRETQRRNMMAVAEKCPAPVFQARTLKTTRMRSIINSYRLTQAYKSDSKVAYVGEQFPTELVFAFDYIAWNIESMAILFAQSGDVDEFFRLTQENSLSRDICSFLRGPFGFMLANCYPKPDLVLSNDQPCDCLVKLQYMAGKFYAAPFFSLHTPNTLNEDSISYLVDQMKRLISLIEKESGIKLEQEYFDLVIRRSNEAKEYYSKTVELLRKYSLPGVGRELQEIFGMNFFGVKETAQMCRTLYEEALEMTRDPENAKKKKRVLWVGQIPESSHELLDCVEKELELLYWAPLWEANLMVLDTDDQLRSIAKRAILLHWHSDRMRKELFEMCDNFEIDGILIANMWGCRNMMGISPMLKKIAAEKNIKCSIINVDLVDKNNYSFPQVKNRIDAFLEIVK